MHVQTKLLALLCCLALVFDFSFVSAAGRKEIMDRGFVAESREAIKREIMNALDISRRGLIQCVNILSGGNHKTHNFIIARAEEFIAYLRGKKGLLRRATLPEMFYDINPIFSAVINSNLEFLLRNNFVNTHGAKDDFGTILDTVVETFKTVLEDQIKVHDRLRSEFYDKLEVRAPDALNLFPKEAILNKLRDIIIDINSHCEDKAFTWANLLDALNETPLRAFFLRPWIVTFIYLMVSIAANSEEHGTTSNSHDNWFTSLIDTYKRSVNSTTCGVGVGNIIEAIRDYQEACRRSAWINRRVEEYALNTVVVTTRRESSRVK